MTHVFSPTFRERSKWRQQADKAAAHLKASSLDKDQIKVGFVFDDGVVTVEVSAQSIREKKTRDLADYLYNSVLLAAQTEGNA